MLDGAYDGCSISVNGVCLTVLPTPETSLHLKPPYSRDALNLEPLCSLTPETRNLEPPKTEPETRNLNSKPETRNPFPET